MSIEKVKNMTENMSKKNKWKIKKGCDKIIKKK